MTAVSLRHARRTAVVLVTLAAFTDILAYSVAVPVLPDLGRRLGASPTVIGLLFASFGLSVALVAVPAGAMSDRLGRRGPLLAGALLLTLSTLLFAAARTLPWLFLARFAQGIADALTWVVGFALVADLYDADERGRMMGFVMSGTTVGFLLGPTIGGWLYESVGPQVPYLLVAALSALCAGGFAWMAPPVRATGDRSVPMLELLRVPDVAICAATVAVGGGTLAMVEPTFALHLDQQVGLGPARIGVVIGGAAMVSAVLHPVLGRIADRVGGRRLMLIGLAGLALALPALSLVRDFAGGLLIYALFTIPIVTMVTPSLAYMADATASAGVRSFGVAYGVYNVAWAVGLLVGPAIGGAVFERAGFAVLTTAWAATLLPITLLLARIRSTSRHEAGV